jgi:hypothetical protein
MQIPSADSQTEVPKHAIDLACTSQEKYPLRGKKIAVIVENKSC